jgi:hypothetical protein
MSLNEPARIDAAALAPGDVLLSRGIGEISDLICAIDGGSYSHAGIWTGSGVVHAAFEGIARAALEASLADRHHVDVFRYLRDGAALGSARWPAEPVVACATSFVGGAYAYSDLLMLALLIGYGRRPGVPALDSAVRKIGAHLAARLDDWFERRTAHGAVGRPGPMTCTELVGTAFYAAASVPAHAYALEVVLPGRSSAPPPALSGPDPAAAEYERVAETIRRVLRRHGLALDADAPPEASSADPPHPPALFGVTRPRRVIAGGSGLPLRTLTPRDLETSPTLVRVGRLAEPSAGR